jgi:hypothetical protein
MHYRLRMQLVHCRSPGLVLSGCGRLQVLRSFRDEGPIGRCRYGKADASLHQPTPCSQSQIEQDCHLARRRTAQVTAVIVLSVGVRSGPVMTAVNGTLVARPVEKDAGTAWQP